MKYTRLWTASMLAVVIAAPATFAQEKEAIEVRVRAIAGPDGKLEVVEEKIVGPEETKGTEEAQTKSTGKAEGKAGAVRAGVIKLYQRAAEKVAGKLAEVSEAGEAADVSGEELPTSDYWIGVQLEPLPDQLRKHLPLKYGVLVSRVFEDSPAAKADVQADDILLQADEIRLEAPASLIKAVDAAKLHEMKVILLREGKEVKASIKPVKREEAKERLTEVAPNDPGRLARLRSAQQQFEKALEALRAETAGANEANTIDLMMVRPGAFVYGASGAKLPDDVKVQITRQGDSPAKVRVERGDKSWDVTADKLDGLPKELRPHVEAMLFGMPAIAHFTPAEHANRIFTTRVQGFAPGTVFDPSTMTQRAVPSTAAVPSVTVTKPVPGMAGVYQALPHQLAQAKPAQALSLNRGAAWTVETSQAGLESKVDQILKKLDSLGSSDLEEMKKELKALRKEVNELREKNKDAESTKKE
ncbi:PDZ domain-containing protein [Anatilimnocola sp. NA78]|uniref:PDZ domain-containing protein n=1 Tax=Anatilimnocola sp. NA78 TaxID=3415683 RepID=UPI003CE4B3BA